MLNIKITSTEEQMKREDSMDVDGLAGVTLKRKDDGYECAVILVGNLSFSDLFQIHSTITKELLTTIKDELVKSMVSKLGGTEKDED